MLLRLNSEHYTLIIYILNHINNSTKYNVTYCIKTKEWKQCINSDNRLY